jgi:hypothetical protein
MGIERREGDKAGPMESGLAGWLFARLRGLGGARPRLRLIERIALAPRQSLALVEAEGRRLLVATSVDGAPAFFPLDERAPRTIQRRAGDPGPGVEHRSPQSAARISW